MIRSSTPILLLALLPFLPAGLASASQEPADPKPKSVADVIEVSRCELEFEQSTLIGANSGAVASLTVQDCLVELGDKVKAGQILGHLNDSELQARLLWLDETAKSDIDIRVSESKLKEAQDALKRVENLRARGQKFASDEEYSQVRNQAETALLMAEQAKHQQRLAKLECMEVQVQIKNRAIVAPHDGTVVQVFKKLGEAVTGTEPLFWIVNTDVVRVTGFLNLEQYGQVAPGQLIDVFPETDDLNPEGEKVAVSHGSVIFVDRRVDPANRTSKVVARVEHAADNLPAGIEAKMNILPKSAGFKTVDDRSKKPTPPAVKPVAEARRDSAKPVAQPSLDLSNNPNAGVR